MWAFGRCVQNDSQVENRRSLENENEETDDEKAGIRITTKPYGEGDITKLDATSLFFTSLKDQQTLFA